MPRSTKSNAPAEFVLATVLKERAAGVSLNDLCTKYGLAMSTLRGRLIRAEDATPAPAARTRRAPAPERTPAGRNRTSERATRTATTTGVETVAQTRARHRAEKAAGSTAPKARRR